MNGYLFLGVVCIFVAGLITGLNNPYEIKHTEPTLHYQEMIVINTDNGADTIYIFRQ